MKLVTSPLTTDYGATGTLLPAETRMVVPDWCSKSLAIALREHGEHPVVSGIGSYLRPYFGQDLAGKRLLAHRGLGVGDQMVFAGLLSILKRLWPSADITMFCHPSLIGALWGGAELPFEVRPEPILFEADWLASDYHLIGQDWCESDKEPDQADMWTGHLRCAGLDPDGIPDSWRKPAVPVRGCDIEAARAFDEARGGDPMVLWQLAASTPIRSYRPDLTRRAMELLLERVPEAVVVATGNDAQFAEYHPLPDGVRTTGGLSIREVMALAELASVVVCPDSYLGHVTGACGTPTVSLWSSFLPADRVGSYRSHSPLVGAIECSPCRTHESGAIQGCPRVYEDETACRHCEGLARISPEEIVDAVAKEI